MHFIESKNLYENGISFAEFTQNQGDFVCGLENSITVITTNNLIVSAQINIEGGLNHAALMLEHNKIAVVGSGLNKEFQPNQVKFVDITTNEISERKIESNISDIRGIITSKNRIIVLLESLIQVYRIKEGTLFLTLLGEFESKTNPKGLCVFRAKESLLIFPGPDTGSLKIVNLNFRLNYIIVPAHRSPLACIARNFQGTRIATASEKGTLIRIFDAFTGKLLNELRRGTSQANILSINFNSDSSMLCVSSDHGTIHVFYLTENIEKDEKNSYFGSSISGYLPGFVSGIASAASSAFLPTYINSTWSSYKFDVPNKVPCICGFTTENKIAAVCANGKVYHFSRSEKENSWEVGKNFLEIKEDTAASLPNMNAEDTLTSVSNMNAEDTLTSVPNMNAEDTSTSVPNMNAEIQQESVESPENEPETDFSSPELEVQVDNFVFLNIEDENQLPPLVLEEEQNHLPQEMGELRIFTIPKENDDQIIFDITLE